jgi:3',5'-cyclic AMP phosphodiesterase CpdA
VSSQDRSSNVFVLAHLSDPHLAPVPRPRIAALASKRLTGYLNWVRKRRAIHRCDVLAAIVRDLKGAGADHIAVTGDVVNIALPAEFEHARCWLEELGPPADVSLVPGNHDAYVAAAEALRARLWAPYMTGDAAAENAGAKDGRPSARRGATSPSPRVRGEGRGEGVSPDAGAVEAQSSGEAPSPGARERDVPLRAGGGAHTTRGNDEGEAERFPFLRVRGPVALIGVSTAVPTSPFMATGRLGERQITRMSALLAGAAARFRVVLIHHPPHVVPKSHMKRLVDADAFRQAIATAGAELVIHGHDHVRSLAFIDGPRAGVPMIGVPSASAAFGTDHDPAGYNLYGIDGRPGAWSCDVICRGLASDGAVVECERFTV